MDQNRSRFTPIEDILKELYVFLSKKVDEPIPLSDLLEFLLREGYAEDERMAHSKRRALLRKLDGHPNFQFYGSTRDRYIGVNNDPLQRDFEQANADKIVRTLLDSTIKEGATSLYQVEFNNEEDINLHHPGIDILVQDGVLEKEPTSDSSWGWGKRSFFGYEVKTKRSTALSLPVRAWDHVDEVIQDLYNMKHVPEATRTEIENNHPILHLMLMRGPPFTKSEITELAIEHLRSTLTRLSNNTQPA